jgi:hypothetical protein
MLGWNYAACVIGEKNNEYVEKTTRGKRERSSVII